MASKIASKFEELGNQVTAVQNTTTTMLNDFSNQLQKLEYTNTLLQAQLNNHQNAIDNNQKALDIVQGKILVQQNNITNQFKELAIVHTNLLMDQTNLSAQAEKLSQVEYWTHNIFDNYKEEAFDGNDTNHVLVVSLTNNECIAVVRLSYVPITNSVQADVRTVSLFGVSSQKLLAVQTGYNIQIILFQGVTSIDDRKLFFRYVADTRATSYYKEMPILNKNVWINSNKSYSVVPPN